jgi:hypothetical protein
MVTSPGNQGLNCCTWQATCCMRTLEARSPGRRRGSRAQLQHKASAAPAAARWRCSCCRPCLQQQLIEMRAHLHTTDAMHKKHAVTCAEPCGVQLGLPVFDSGSLTGVAIPAGAAEAAVAVGAARVRGAPRRATHTLVDVDVAGGALVPATTCKIACCLPAAAVLVAIPISISDCQSVDRWDSPLNYLSIGLVVLYRQCSSAEVWQTLGPERTQCQASRSPRCPGKHSPQGQRMRGVCNQARASPACTARDVNSSARRCACCDGAR